MSRKSLVLSVLILLGAGGLLVVIFNTEPEAQRGGATKQTAMLVDVISAERGSFRPQIEVMGTVEPSRDVVLSPRVAGEIVERSDAFTPGGIVRRGEVLVRIDPADYRNALSHAEADLRQAEADLKLEMGQQDIAQKDYELLGGDLEGEDKELVLRGPQLDTARAMVESARTAVEQAELDLDRTTVRAPFDAHVLRRDVDVGSQVAAGAALGRLVGIETYWVVATVPLSKLRQISVPDDEDDSSASVARVRDRAAWPGGVTREGRVYRLLGELAADTRMARVLVTVEDPLSRNGPSEGDVAEEAGGEVPSLMLGSFVELVIEGGELRDVVRLDRDYVRQNDTVWVDDGGELSIRDVEIVFRDAEYAYLAGGVEAGEYVVTTNLSTVTEGAALRRSSESDQDESDADSGESS